MSSSMSSPKNKERNATTTSDFIGYLRADVIAEPLINQWYAWSYLIPPATAARYLTGSQLKVMQSFVDAPEVHEATLRDPAMQGGPFVQHPASRVEEVRSLIETTKQSQHCLLALSVAIAQLQAQLANHPRGASLEPLYEKIPAALKGYVELVYDAQNSASIRFIEGLLYRSDYYTPTSQSIALRIGDCDQRAFVMSTPRLPDHDSLFLPIPFADARLDQLFQMRHTPSSVGAIATLLNIPEQQRSFFYRLFTTEPVQSASIDATAPDSAFSNQTANDQTTNNQADGVRIRYFGHACVLIETDSVSILCDPLISYTHPTGIRRYSYSDLPDTIDYALITHNHQDHVMLETLLQLRHKIKHIVVPSSQKGSLLDPSLKLALQQIGFSQVLTLDELESVALPDGKIISIPVLGEHGDLNIATKNAYWISLKGRSILCAADSNNLDQQLYAHIHHLLGDLDLLFLGMECEGAPFTWAYGPLLPTNTTHTQAQSRRLDGSNAQRALALVNQLNPQQVYVYAMGQEPWLTYITSIDYAPDAAPILESNQLIEACRAQGRVCDRLFGQHQVTLSAQSQSARESSSIPVTVSSDITTSDITTSPQNRPSSRPFSQSTATPMDTPDTLTPLLTQLKNLNVRLWLEGDTLRCNAPKGTLTPALTAQLKEHKPAIIALLGGSIAHSTANYDSADSQAVDNKEVPLAQTNKPTAPTILTDWQKDITLPDNIRPTVPSLPTASSQSSGNVIITGATGFLGAFLLYELMQQTNNTVYCLIRVANTNDNSAAGLSKIKACLSRYKSWDDTFESRLIPVIGDLSKPLLGLSPQRFYEIANLIDVIYHNGAQVHHLSPYAQLRTTNILGTLEILKLACQGKPKALHYTSTLSVLPPAPLPGETKLYEQTDLSQYPAPVGGYNRTKWVAEQLVTQARDRNLPTTIYRPGPISGHSQTGVFNTNDFLYRLMQGYIQSEMAPDGEIPLDLLPVDYAAKAIVYLSNQPLATGKAFHLIHPQPASSNLLFNACQSMGYPIARVTYETWHKKLIDIAKGDRTHPLYPLVALFSSRQTSQANSQANSRANPRQSSPNHTAALPEIPFDTEQTYTYLKEAPFDLPPLDQSLFNIYLKEMTKQNLSSPVLV